MANVIVELKDGTQYTINSDSVLRTHSDGKGLTTIICLERGKEKAVISRTETLPDEILNPR